MCYGKDGGREKHEIKIFSTAVARKPLNPRLLE